MVYLILLQYVSKIRHQKQPPLAESWTHTCTNAQINGWTSLNSTFIHVKNVFLLGCQTLDLYLKLQGFLPPAKEVWGKVIFLHVSVILFTVGGGGVCLWVQGDWSASGSGGASGSMGCLPLDPWGCLHLSLRGVYTSPEHTRPPGHSPGHTDPGHSMVKKRTARILLECFLVLSLKYCNAM